MDTYQMHPVTESGQAPPSSSSSGMTMDAFLSTVETINASIASLPASINTLESHHSSSLRDPDPTSSSQVRKQITASHAAITSTITEITNTISHLATDAGNTTTDYRGEKFNHIKNLRRKLSAQIHAFESMNARIEKEHREQLIRQYSIVRPDASREEVEAAVDSGNEEIFAHAILSSGRSSSARSTLQSVRARQAEIQRLAETMQQLNELFQSMARLIDEQDQKVKDIETGAEVTVENVDQANNALDSGIKHAKLRRKWKWYCLWICVAIILILVLIIVIYFKVILPGQQEAARKATGG